MKLNLINSPLKADLELIEKELEKSIHSDIDLLQEASIQLLKAGGKRIRPIFVLLCAKFGTYDIHNVKNTAIALELIHMASLVHDDVIDEADLRRGRPTISYTWNDRVAMYTGDYMLARSLDYMTNIEDPMAHRILAKAIVEVCKGEIEQIKDKYRFDQNIRDYLRRIKRKTALLIAVSCELGAVSAGADEKTYRILYRFGYCIGMSYQIIDDILDFTATEETLGKPAGEDLRQGNITLPALYAMEDTQLRERIFKIRENIDTKEMEQIITHIKNSDAIEKSYDLSQKYLNKALVLLNDLPANPAKKMLQDIAKYIGKRKY
ncbi:heptaprenyl diphosphate synthase component II [Lederbergia galactosidilytica]|uniref:Heptaprenyl diphosphate synthase component 2 n=1 Tax=Lederbergia galactosidilytica TaxID=217031 RepID=A0A177ZSD9_9BACI|nr:heptaprenyl diphosphate synthase component II [Lederbergia galactosidilytica]KRG12510.1 heptaprenyl diphosphate synthase [Virgibacillus soli]MBP1914633.1 heptaprenyl diphosphate synthase [Lederbergia galactosidilytica]OAK69778.1 heptaprenyl diphosphate synthase [Lederbergia galactosidilytica]